MNNNEIDIYERMLTTKYRQCLWSKFLKAIYDYKLLTPGDKVCVCISGGKDSMLLAKLFTALTKFMDFKIEVKYLVMNPGYKEEVMRENEKRCFI